MTPAHAHSPLLTDLYQLTMAYGYWKHNRHEDEAVFHLFFRKAPFKGGYALAAGLADVIEFCKGFRFSEADLTYLSDLKGADGTPLFEAKFLSYLADMQFSCSLDAMPEGSVAFAHEPLIRVQGPLIQCQLLETALLTLVNFPTLIATKASRIVQAAEGDPVLEFGLRRAQGLNGGLSASRAAFIGGCVATSNVLAGQQYGIPIKGTHAHSWVMSFEEEEEAFEAYAEAMPHNCILLVDTYDTLEGVKKAIKVGLKLREKGHDLLGIRLDSGDLCELSKKARELLDEAGFQGASIVASNDLDEYAISQLKQEGAKINVWGIGTKLATAYDQPALGGVYKLAALRKPGQEWQFKIKLSNQAIKVSNPGILQVERIEKDGQWVADRIFHSEETERESHLHTFSGETIDLSGSQSALLLLPIFEAGAQRYYPPTLAATQAFAQQQLSKLPQSYRNLTVEAPYPVGLSTRLAEKKQALISAHRQ